MRITRTWSDDISDALARITESDARRHIGGQRVYLLSIGRLTILIDRKKRRSPNRIHTDDLFGHFR